ncbi:hypothetical protein HanRHA438_Chr07g0323051 [Helianthus annuus]|nr:hypothetical protein HanRHA438_Chr07g0323051 [Helianthus annuus]
MGLLQVQETNQDVRLDILPSFLSQLVSFRMIVRKRESFPTFGIRGSKFSKVA